MNALKKNWYFIIPAVLIFLPVLATFYISVAYGYTLGEAWEVFKSKGQEQTKFQALKYSESKFRQIRPGMSGRDVFEMVGLPLERHNEDLLWHYSLPLKGAEFFHERSIVMQPGTGKVAQVICRYHQPQAPAK